jgi:SAM-dependent methyltransferase
MLARIRNALKPLARTPLHPQWLATMARDRVLPDLAAIRPGATVVDVGCFDAWPRRHLPAGCRYVGIDYLETAADWYGSRPDVYGDASRLPLRERSVDVVLMFSVLEHLADPQAALAGIGRALKPDGRLVMEVPFLYPLHDRPRDFSRFTSHGFEQLAARSGLRVLDCTPIGTSPETAALLANIALARTVLDWAARWNPLALLGVLLPIAVVANNLLARLAAFTNPDDDLMPHSYRVVMAPVGE